MRLNPTRLAKLSKCWQPTESRWSTASHSLPFDPANEINQGRGRSRAEPAATRLLILWWQETAEAVWSEATRMTKFKGEAGVAPSPLQQGYLLCGGKKLLKRFGAKRQSNYD